MSDNSLLISLDVDKEPYIKQLTNDNVINLTGESGSGKSYFSDKWKNDDNYIVIDTDIVFGNRSFNNKYEEKLHSIFVNKFEGDLRNELISNFDECYKIIIDALKGYNKTIVIDSAQYRNINDIRILRGKVIVMRTSINICYERCLSRFDNIKSNATKDERDEYAKRKLNIYDWYHSLNEFLLKIDAL